MTMVSLKTYESMVEVVNWQKLLNIKSPESLPYQSQITVDMLNTAPIPKQWINEDSMSLISQTMGVVEPDGHSYYYYEYKIQNESILMVKKADTENYNEW